MGTTTTEKLADALRAIDECDWPHVGPSHDAALRKVAAALAEYDAARPSANEARAILSDLDELEMQGQCKRAARGLSRACDWLERFV